jgi:hypothetical protein
MPAPLPDDETGQDRSPVGQLRSVLDELIVAGVLDRGRRNGIAGPGTHKVQSATGAARKTCTPRMLSRPPTAVRAAARGDNERAGW